MRTPREVYMESLERKASEEEPPTQRVNLDPTPEVLARRQYFREYQRQYRKRNREKTTAAAAKSNAQQKRSRPAYNILVRRRYQAKIRLLILEFFGGKCVLCGYADHRALQLDHINGDGAKLAREEGRQTTSSQYTLIRSEPELARARYRLLCANCNQIKRYENMELRHTPLNNM